MPPVNETMTVGISRSVKAQVPALAVMEQAPRRLLLIPLPQRKPLPQLRLRQAVDETVVETVVEAEEEGTKFEKR